MPAPRRSIAGHLALVCIGVAMVAVVLSTVFAFAHEGHDPGEPKAALPAGDLAEVEARRPAEGEGRGAADGLPCQQQDEG